MTGLGCDAFRMRCSGAILGKFAVIFVASIICNELKVSCDDNDQTTNKMITELERMEMFGGRTNGYYSIVHGESARQKQVPLSWGIIPSALDAIAEEYNFRSKAAVSSPVWDLPEEELGHGKSGKKKEAEAKEPPQKDSGRNKRMRGRSEWSVKKRAPKQPRGEKSGFRGAEPWYSVNEECQQIVSVSPCQ